MESWMWPLCDTPGAATDTMMMTWAPRGSQEGRSTLSIIKFTRVAIEARMSKV